MIRHSLCVLPLWALMTGCIAPQNYHQKRSLFHYDYRTAGTSYSPGYFAPSEADLAFLEFDSRGLMYRDGNNNKAQLQAILSRIAALRHSGPSGAERPITVLVFVHGWKNNASEDSGNVWGFRRVLSDVAAATSGSQPQPTLGIYIGWPGDAVRVGKFFSFWNREPVADAVGAGDLPDALEQILRATKNDDYAGLSTALLVGHSFGGLVMERAATRILDHYLDTHPGQSGLAAPADLIVLLNEAGAAGIGVPFMKRLDAEKLVYSRSGDHPLPLLVSMTSVGDVATKLAYPGGEFVGLSTRPKTEPLPPGEVFGQKTTLAYNLQTAANMGVLQSHRLVLLDSSKPQNCLWQVPVSQGPTYCLQQIPEARNKTPYWVMQLPQLFVPDHSTIFQHELIGLLATFVDQSTALIPVMPRPRGRFSLNDISRTPAKSAATSEPRPVLRRVP